MIRQQTAPEALTDGTLDLVHGGVDVTERSGLYPNGKPVSTGSGGADPEFARQTEFLGLSGRPAPPEFTRHTFVFPISRRAEPKGPDVIQRTKEDI
ncbi:MAG: hypothetical protein AAGD13_15230 [Pseudomonadota bacterium]